MSKYEDEAIAADFSSKKWPSNLQVGVKFNDSYVASSVPRGANYLSLRFGEKAAKGSSV